MIRATTPTHIFVLPFDWSKFGDKLLITYTQGSTVILEKTEKDIQINGNKISLTLTQEEVNIFSAGIQVYVQVRVLTKGGDALASNIKSFSVQSVLNDKVMV